VPVLNKNIFLLNFNHVIEGAQNFTVRMNDGRIFPAQQISADPVTDLAVVKINATGLPSVTVGDSGKLKQGMMAIAIGNALGEGLSVTAGWISRLDVSLTIPASATSSNSTLFDLIAFSTPINPGNSGGPLIDSMGEVVASGVENVG
jgi:serine protease Do